MPQPRRRLGTVPLLAVVALAAQGVGAGIAWLAVARSIYSTSTTAADTLAARIGASLAPAYIELLAQGDHGAVRQRARRDAERFGVHITLARLDGTAVADAAPPEAIPPDPRDASRRVETDQGSWSYTAREVSGAGSAYILRVGAPGVSMAQARRDATRAVAPPMLAALALTGLVFLASGRAARRDAGAIRAAAQEIVAGDADARLPLPADGAMAAATDAVNDAIDALAGEIARRRMQHRKARAVVRSMPVGVLTLDTEQRIVSVNRVAEQMLGVKERAAQGRLLQEAVRSAALNAFMARAYASEKPATGEVELDTPSGRTVQISSRALRAIGGGVGGRVVVLYDVTRLRRLERVRRDFAANVSHELRTPITNIKGYVETLLELGPDDPDASRRFLEVVARNVDRLHKIVEGMLDLARLEAPGAGAELELDAVRALPLLEAVCAGQRDAAGAREMTLRVDAPPELSAPMNRRLVEQALQNLVANAIKYGRAGTEVVASAGVVAGDDGREMLELRVQDRGPGIEKRHLVRIFERFYRADAARTREAGGEGAGLGLAIVKHIARLHGGREGVDSALGQGSRFWIRIPLAPGLEGPAEEPEGGAAT